VVFRQAIIVGGATGELVGGARPSIKQSANIISAKQ